jgi:hypothetical protein
MRCDAQHCEDSRPCVGPVDAVTIRAAAGDAATGCVLHGAVILASLIGALATRTIVRALELARGEP